MKKLCALIICAVTLFSAVFYCAAADVGENKISIYLNGGALEIPQSFGTPFYDGAGRLQIPMRYIFEKCGYKIIWDQNTRTVTVPTGSGDLSLGIGSNILRFDGAETVMDTAATLGSDGRTYIPLRFALEALNFTVSWQKGEKTDTVLIDGKIGGLRETPLGGVEIADIAEEAVFYIEVSFEGVPFASGSGFFIDKEGTAVTNFHVLADSDYAEVTMTDGEIYAVDEVLFFDYDRDFAVIKVSKTSQSGKERKYFPYLITGDSGKIKNGETIYTVGSPLGFSNSISSGLVSNKLREVDGMQLIQISAPISHGSSGGALINERGEAVGIPSGGYAAGQNLNFAVPINFVLSSEYGKDGFPYAQFPLERFLKEVANPKKFCEKIINVELYLYDEIRSGQTLRSPFNLPGREGEAYFYLPVPSYVTVTGMAERENRGKYQEELDIIARRHGEDNWDEYVQKSIKINLVKYPDEGEILPDDYAYTVLRTATCAKNADGDYVHTTERIKLEAGWYSILEMPTIENFDYFTDAWGYKRKMLTYLLCEE